MVAWIRGTDGPVHGAMDPGALVIIVTLVILMQTGTDPWRGWSCPWCHGSRSTGYYCDNGDFMHSGTDPWHGCP